MVVRLLLAAFEGPEVAGRAAATWVDYAQAMAQKQEPVEDVHLQVVSLPVSHDRAAGEVLDLLRMKRFDYFLLVGTDPASSDYKLHALAANYADDPRPDAQGKALEDVILDPEGPVAYRTRLPLDGIWDKFMVEGVPVRMSHKAGLWVFNHVLYDVMRALDVEGSPTRCGAIELPPLVGEESADAQGRDRPRLEEEFHMVLAVLEQLNPMVEATGEKRGASADTDLDDA